MKIKVDTDYLKEQNYNIQLKTKQKAFIDLFSYCQEFVNVNRSELYKSPLQTFKIAFTKEHSQGFSQLISYEKQLELSGISLDKITHLAKQFESIDIELDIETFQPKNKVDFSIYITDKKHIENYNRGKFLLDKIDELAKHGITVNPIRLMRAFPDLLEYDYKANNLKPAYNY